MNKLNPGSPKAIKQGCICPVLDNEGGDERLTGGMFVTRQDCPLHGWEENGELEVTNWVDDKEEE